ncbi:MAG: hypothetical protein WAK56_00815, partial [Candidatus Sulfotelmatobacter sp.]
HIRLAVTKLSRASLPIVKIRIKMLFRYSLSGTPSAGTVGQYGFTIQAIDLVVVALRRGGRLIYIGAGTSGATRHSTPPSVCPLPEPITNPPHGLAIGCLVAHSEQSNPAARDLNQKSSFEIASSHQRRRRHRRLFRLASSAANRPRHWLFSFRRRCWKR